MASLLESLTQHYDRCSEALKTTESAQHIEPALYQVLSRDAAQVDDAVHELKERLSEMEEVFGNMSRRLADFQNLERDTIKVFFTFEQFGAELGVWMQGLQEFEARQGELKNDMAQRLEELWQVGGFYESFVGAYDAMVVEVGRRRGVAARMETVVKEARRKLEALYDGAWSHFFVGGLFFLGADV